MLDWTDIIAAREKTAKKVVKGTEKELLLGLLAHRGSAEVCGREGKPTAGSCSLCGPEQPRRPVSTR